MADNEVQAPASGGGKSLAKVAQLLFVVMNLATLGFGAFLTYTATLGVETQPVHEVDEYARMLASRESAAAHPVLHRMEPFVVNLAGTPRRTIRLEIILELLNDEGFEEIMNMTAGARDSIVEILNDKTFSEVETIQGKLFLKDQIAATLNRHLKRGVVTDVYFSDFIVQ